MERTKLREMIEGPGQTTAFLPNPPTTEFRKPRVGGFYRVIAVSISADEKNWTRGWQFTLFGADDDNNPVAVKYADFEEMGAIEQLLRKQHDETVEMGYQHTSLEGVVFKVFGGNQRVSMHTAIGLMDGMESEDFVGEVLDFMKSSAKLWE
jgi:hypothetical protein